MSKVQSPVSATSPIEAQSPREPGLSDGHVSFLNEVVESELKEIQAEAEAADHIGDGYFDDFIDENELDENGRASKLLYKSINTAHGQRIIIKEDSHHKDLKECLNRTLKEKFRERVSIQNRPSSGINITVDTSKARSNTTAVRLCLQELGWREYPFGRKHIACDVYWSSLKFDDYSSVVSGHINKFPGVMDVMHKAHLSVCLKTFWKLFPDEFQFFPRTWLYPSEKKQFLSHVDHRTYVDKAADDYYIVKPNDGSYELPANMQLELDPDREYIVQEYIPDPFLIDGYKFDLRVYVTLNGLEPLSAHVAKDGLARFCTKTYEKPNDNNYFKTFMHLTNYSLNKESVEYVHNDNMEDGSKRSILSVLKKIEDMGHNTKKLWRDIELLIAKTLYAIAPDLKVNMYAEMQHRRCEFSCFQILGFDILLLADLSPVLLEINANPSLRIDYEVNRGTHVELIPSRIDEAVKKPLIFETLLLIAPRAKQKLVQKRKGTQSDSASGKVTSAPLPGNTNVSANTTATQLQGKPHHFHQALITGEPRLLARGSAVMMQFAPPPPKPPSSPSSCLPVVSGRSSSFRPSLNPTPTNRSRSTSPYRSENGLDSAASIFAASGASVAGGGAADRKSKVATSTTSNPSAERAQAFTTTMSPPSSSADKKVSVLASPTTVIEYRETRSAMFDRALERRSSLKESMSPRPASARATHLDLPQLADGSGSSAPSSTRAAHSSPVIKYPERILHEILPERYGMKFLHLRILDGAVRLFRQCLGVKGATYIGRCGFRLFARKCQLAGCNMSIAEFDMLFINIQKLRECTNEVNGARVPLAYYQKQLQGGLTFQGFVEAISRVADVMFSHKKEFAARSARFQALISACRSTDPIKITQLLEENEVKLRRMLALAIERDKEARDALFEKLLKSRKYVPPPVRTAPASSHNLHDTAYSRERDALYENLRKSREYVPPAMRSSVGAAPGGVQQSSSNTTIHLKPVLSSQGAEKLKQLRKIYGQHRSINVQRNTSTQTLTSDEVTEIMSNAQRFRQGTYQPSTEEQEFWFDRLKRPFGGGAARKKELPPRTTIAYASATTKKQQQAGGGVATQPSDTNKARFPIAGQQSANNMAGMKKKPGRSKSPVGGGGGGGGSNQLARSVPSQLGQQSISKIYGDVNNNRDVSPYTKKENLEKRMKVGDVSGGGSSNANNNAASNLASPRTRALSSSSDPLPVTTSVVTFAPSPSVPQLEPLQHAPTTLYNIIEDVPSSMDEADHREASALPSLLPSSTLNGAVKLPEIKT